MKRKSLNREAKKGKKTSSVSEEEVCPKTTLQAFHYPHPLDSRHRGSSLVAELLRPVPSPGQGREVS